MSETPEPPEAGPLDVLRASTVAMLLVDPGTREIVAANEAAGTLYGLAPDALAGTSVDRLDARFADADSAAPGAGPGIHLWAGEHLVAGAEPRAVDVVTERVRLDGRPLVRLVVLPRDGEHARRARLELLRMQQAMTEVNRASLKARDEPRIWEEACRIVAETAGYRMASIATPDENGLLRVRVAAGAVGDYLDHRLLDLSDPASTPTGLAAAERRTVIVDDIADPSMTTPNKAAALRNGYRSACLVPLVHGPDLFGILAVFGDRPHLFDPVRVSLLERLAEDLVLAHVLQWSARELRASEERYRLLVERASDGISTHDTHGRFLDLNPAACEILGRPREEILGRRLEDFADGRAVAWDEADWQAVLAGGAVSFEQRVRHADGRILSIDIRARLLPDGNVEAISRDVTAQRESEAERDRLARAAAQTADSIVITDLDGTIVYVNAAFERSTGYSRELAIGQNPRILRSGVQDPAYYREMWQAIAAGEAWSGELVNRRRDGSLYREAMVIGPVRDAGGAVVNYVGVKRDITRVRELEEQLAQAAKMEAIGLLAGGIAHDFNNILTAITGYAALVRAAVPEDGPVSADVDEIATAAARAQALTSQLLAFGRRQRLEPRPTDIRDVVAGLGPMLERLIGEDVTLRTEVGTVPAVASVDASRLEHALVNLVVNARNAMPEGGTIRITVDRVEDGAPEGLHAGPWVVLGVVDSGVGMTADVAARIFEPFYTTHGQGEGTGLGLAIVDGFIRQSGGEIRVISSVGRGSTFRIFLPATDGAQDSATEAPVPGSAREPGAAPGAVVASPADVATILVVEDEPVLRTLAERTLMRAGHHVLMAADGDQALRIAAAHDGRIDLLFSDVVMPGLRGSSLAEMLRALRPDLRVLLTSGYTQDDVGRRGIVLGRDGFLPKPYTPQGLVRAVADVLS